MTTANTIIANALTTINVKETGQAIDAEAMQLGLMRLNDMVDAWAIESLYAFSTTEYSGTINGGTVTIGPAGNIVTPFVPLRLEGAFSRLANLDTPIDLVNYLDFADIRLKNIVGPYPRIGYYDGSGVLLLHPVPSTIELHVSAYERLSEFASLTADYTLRPGFRKALQYSLAEELCNDFARPMPPGLAALALRSRRMLKRNNHVVPQMGKVAATDYDLYPPGFSGDNYDGALDPT